MLPEPLHPAVVHFPIVLIFLVPAAAVYAIVAIRRGAYRRPAWAPVLLLAAVLFASALVSVNTGEAQEEVVEGVVGEDPIHDHEEAAEGFLIASGVLLGLAMLGLAGGATGKAARAAVVAGSIVVLFMGFQVGRSGGELVYTHGAAQAWTDRGESAVGAVRGSERRDRPDGEAGHAAEP